MSAAHDSLLLIYADALDDLERVRIATENRVRSLIEVKGLEGSPEEQQMRDLADAIKALEKTAVKDLERAMRIHPLGPWQKQAKGVGEKQLGRLLAAIGNPADRPNVAKLWQYCGHGDPARSHCRKGRPVEHSPVAKMRVHLIAKSCIKQMDSPYRAVYDRERAKWADREVSLGHQDNHALRVVGKEVLKDLWVAARQVAAL